MIITFVIEVRKYTSSKNTRHSVTDTTDQHLFVTFACAHGLEVPSRTVVCRCISEGRERLT